MIIREFGVRQARRALARPVGQACSRALSTQPTQPTLTELAESLVQTPKPTKSQLPAIFTASAKPAVQRRKPAPEVDTTGETYHENYAMKKKLGAIGTKVIKQYRPRDLFLNPPGPKDVTLELLMASQAHMGHHTSLWNPANARYIYGIRQGIHIISLEETAAHLRRAARVVEEVAYRGGLILFVGTRPGQMQIVTRSARLAGACHLFTKWKPGSITNSDIILSGMPLRMLDEHDKPLQGFDRHLNDRRALIPDLVVCLNPIENYTLLHECALVNVPSIGVIDTNAEPSWVTYAIPANDDSLRCLSVIGSVLGRGGEAGKRRRLEDAKKGKVEWSTPLSVQKYVKLTREHAQEQEQATEKATEKVDNDFLDEETDEVLGDVLDEVEKVV